MREIRISNLEPLILDPNGGVSNERSTLDYIPGSRLRGAVYSALEQLAPGITPEKLFAYDGPRWSNAFPSTEDWEPLRPRPRCMKKSKDNRVQWYRNNAGILEPVQPAVEINMRVARHYGRRAHRDTALYARSALSPGQQFVAWVESDDLAITLNESEQEISIGTRKSANGGCKISVVDSPTPPFQTSSWQRRNPLIMMLLSDAIIPGKHGSYLRGLNADAFPAELGVEILAAHSSWKTVGGWSGQWGLPRESAIAIEAGSVWLLEVRDIEKFDAFVQQGIGVRRFEGFGWVEVDPDYITAEREQNGTWKLEVNVAESESDDDPQPTIATWPGLEGTDLGTLERILEEEDKSNQVPENPGEVYQQIATLKRSGTPDSSEPLPLQLFRLQVRLELSKQKGKVDGR